MKTVNTFSIDDCFYFYNPLIAQESLPPSPPRFKMKIKQLFLQDENSLLHNESLYADILAQITLHHCCLPSLLFTPPLIQFT